MRIESSAHTTQPWRIHEITHDFTLEDVWALPTPGGPDDFPRLVDLVSTDEDPGQQSPIFRLLFAIRWKLGALLGWDAPGHGLEARVPSLRDRLPDDLRDGPRGPEIPGKPFRPLYLTDSEYAAEIANSTMHGIMHIAWVPDESGGYRGQMAVLVKPNGLLGHLYMAAIKPFRYTLVYPRLMSGIERQWRRRDTGSHIS
ncbi:hypothetical protein BJY24_003046 [Nocardia transvalensis]|uniref:DUF2867 domain-containing protein n=1 Tax=Nocardia transvalensis TaxID=37333 RepID=A0A7W9UI99_9NOCA|nr:DUF2867 domain-containing protein [Nocardia transvalensis]MBB5914179.1 hypothetical protein [Nocardia transvalensis]